LPAGATEISILAGRRLSFLNECGVPTGMLANVAAGLEQVFYEFGVPVPQGATTAPPPAREEGEKLLEIAPRYGDQRGTSRIFVIPACSSATPEAAGTIPAPIAPPYGVPVGLDRERLEAGLPDVARRPVMAVLTPRVRRQEPVHPTA
jgi:hypothetical protein